MPNDHFRYALELFRNDGASAGQFPVEVDWEPIRQWVRFAALRRNEQIEDNKHAHPVRPFWDEALGKPYVGGFRPAETLPSAGENQHVISTRFLGSLARTLADRLIDEGSLECGAYSYRALAYPMIDWAPAHSSIAVETVDTEPSLGRGHLAHLLPRATRVGDTAADDLPVFVPQGVIRECREQTTAAGDRETGGILIGGLYRDTASGDVFVQVSAQITARYTVAAETSLAFTPETWTQVQGAIDLRRRDETMLGWWHSHPVKTWCKECPAEKRKKCPLLVDYFSAQDRLLHRTVFPAAYGIALVVNELADDKQTLSMFGWREGMIVQRGFQAVGKALAAEPEKDLTIAQEEQG